VQKSPTDGGLVPIQQLWWDVFMSWTNSTPRSRSLECDASSSIQPSVNQSCTTCL